MVARVGMDGPGWMDGIPAPADGRTDNGLGRIRMDEKVSVHPATQVWTRMDGFRDGRTGT